MAQSHLQGNHTTTQSKSNSANDFANTHEIGGVTSQSSHNIRGGSPTYKDHHSYATTSIFPPSSSSTSITSYPQNYIHNNIMDRIDTEDLINENASDSIHSHNSNDSSNASSRPTLIGHQQPQSNPAAHHHRPYASISHTSPSTQSASPSPSSSSTSSAFGYHHPYSSSSSSRPRPPSDSSALFQDGQVTPTYPTSSHALDISDVPLAAGGPAPEGIFRQHPEWTSISSTTDLPSSSSKRQDIVPWFFMGEDGQQSNQHPVAAATTDSPLQGGHTSFFSSETSQYPSPQLEHPSARSVTSLRPQTPPPLHQRSVPAAGSIANLSQQQATTPVTPSSQSSKKFKKPFGFLRKKSFASTKERDFDPSSSSVSLATSHTTDSNPKKSSVSLHSRYSSPPSKSSESRSNVGTVGSSIYSNDNAVASGSSKVMSNAASVTTSKSGSRDRSASQSTTTSRPPLPQYPSKASLRAASGSEFHAHGIDEEQANLDSGHFPDGREKIDKSSGSGKKRRLPRPLTRDRDRGRLGAFGAGSAAGEDSHPSTDSGNNTRFNSNRGVTPSSGSTAGQKSGELEMTLDMNFDHIDDIVDTSLRHNSGPVGPKGEPLQDGLWSSAPGQGFFGSAGNADSNRTLVTDHAGDGEVTPSSPGQYASTRTMSAGGAAGSITLQNAPGPRHGALYPSTSPHRLASVSSGDSSNNNTVAQDLANQRIDVRNRPGLKKVSLAEAQRLAHNDSSRQTSFRQNSAPLLSDGPSSTSHRNLHGDASMTQSAATQQWAKDLQYEGASSADAQEIRKGSSTSRDSGRSGVSPKSSAANLTSHRIPAAETTQLWSRHGLADPGYEFPPSPAMNSVVDFSGRKSSTGSAGPLLVSSTWMAPDSWAVQPDKARDYLRDEEEDEEEDDTDSGRQQRDELSDLAKREDSLRKASTLSTAWSSSHSQTTTSSSAASPAEYQEPLASPTTPSARAISTGDITNVKRFSSVEVLASPGVTTDSAMTPSTPHITGRMPPSKGGAFAAAGGAAAAAANKLGLHRHKGKPASRPNTAGSIQLPSRPATGSVIHADDGDYHNGSSSTPYQLTHPKRPTLTSQSSHIGALRTNYLLRVDTPFGARTVSISLHTTTSELRAVIARKSHPSGAIAYRLFVRDKGSERPLGESEMPALLHKRRMEQAGYREQDGLETLGREDHSYLLRFVYRPDSVPTFDSESFGNTEDIYTHLDLSGRNLEMVPIFLYRHADWIHSLDLSGNPMSDLPGDFIQLCTNLRTLRLSNLALKRIPQSLKSSSTLTHLDLSNNRIPDLSHIALDQIAQLRSFKVQNNRLTELPSYLSRLSNLKQLNVSNNRFEVFPAVICEMAALADLDISFNSVGALPANLGDLKQLESLILVGNSIEKLPEGIVNLSRLRKIDVRRNLLQDVSSLFQLKTLGEAQCEHNSIKAFDATFGPTLRSLNLGHNPMSKLLLGTSAQSQLVSLDLSAANLSRLDETLISQLKSLYDLILDGNQFVSLPESLGDLQELRLLSVTNNHLASLPETIGKLSKLRRLLVHNNNLKSLPNSIWNCSSLTSINASSNLLEFFPLPPLSNEAASAGNNRIVENGKAVYHHHQHLASSASIVERKGSATSLGTTDAGSSTPTTGRNAPPLSASLKKLRLGDNRITHEVFGVLSLLVEVEILNLSFNDIFEVPHGPLAKMPLIRELYLSGNNLSNLPTDDLIQLKLLRILHINANRLQTLPAELGSLTNLANLDVGNNSLKYNIANWHYDWNWNSNPELRYLNLSGNKRLEIKSKMSGITGAGRRTDTSDFQRLSSLRVLGLMDVTVLLQQMPDEHDNRRVRTSLSQINNMSYGVSDALGRFDNLSLVDVIVPNFRKQANECLIGLFEGRGHGAHVGSRIAKHLADWIKHRVEREVAEATLNQEDESPIPSERKMVDVLRRAFLRLQQEYALLLMSEGNRKLSEAKAVAAVDERKSSAPAVAASTTRLHWQAGASGVLLYVIGKTLYVANAGDTLAVLSRGGTADHISTRHEPFDREETQRIRSAEGWVSLRGYVNDSLDVSRSFGYYHLTPFVSAAPAIRSIQLNDSDEFVIVASRALWDQMSYQTAVDIARTEKGDLMIAAQKLRDFAIAYGAEESIMVMVLAVGDLFENRRRGADGILDGMAETYKDVFRKDRGDLPGDRTLARLEREVAPPIGNVALVFTDIKNSTKLWETNGGMQSAMRLHNVLLRRQLRSVGGYEVKTEGDAFMVSFPSVTSALLWCFNVQLQLLKEDWPQEILESEDGKEILDGDANVIHRGLSVRMGIHWGWPVCETDPITRRMDYFGPMVNRASRISGAADGGQIMASRDVINELTKVLGTFDEAGGPIGLLSDSMGAEDPSSSGSASGAADFDEETFRLLHPNVTRDVVLLRRMGFGISEVGERRLKGLETPELLHLVYPRNLANRLATRSDAPAPQMFEPTPSLLDIEEMKTLGMICLRLESLSNAQLFPGIFETAGDEASSAVEGPSTSSEALMTPRIASIPHRGKTVSKYLAMKPELLIMAIRDDAPDDELANTLEQLVVRICNALTVIMIRQQLNRNRDGGIAGGDTTGLRELMGPLRELLQMV
ncbi:unnamed protein product [Sympodiomycopsis kandeliae]